MSAAQPTLFSQAVIVTDGKSEVGDVLIGSNGTIVAVGGDLSEHPGASQAIVIDAKGQWLMPGCIDDQVHFREPGPYPQSRNCHGISRGRSRGDYLLHGNAQHGSSGTHPAAVGR